VAGEPRPGARPARFGPEGSPDARAWERILAGARDLLGEVEVHAADSWYEFTHEPTGIQVSLEATMAAITVPYWYSGARAESVLRLVYRLGQIVESATGLAGYDPQVGMPVSEAVSHLGQGVAVFDRTAAMFAQRGTRTGG
jgi:hypothetical protein